MLNGKKRDFKKCLNDEKNEKQTKEKSCERRKEMRRKRNEEFSKFYKLKKTTLAPLTRQSLMRHERIQRTSG